jgi:hypothetical protein
MAPLPIGNGAKSRSRFRRRVTRVPSQPLQTDPQITLQKLPRRKTGSLSASTDVMKHRPGIEKLGIELETATISTANVITLHPVG